MVRVLHLCEKHNLALLADEVYQANVWAENKPFESFRKVALQTHVPSVEVFSFHSISKGYYGECGLRGGYVHLTNVAKPVHDMLLKLVSVSLCANTLGQAMMASIVNPPQEGDASYPQYLGEKTTVLTALRKKAILVEELLGSMNGVTVQPVEGALYAFPQITLPKKAIEAAEKAGQKADLFYCLRLLQEVGVVTVFGSSLSCI